MGQMHISHVFAITEAQRFQLALVKYPFNNIIRSGFQKFPHFSSDRSEPSGVGRNFGERLPMSVSDLQKAIEVLLFFRTPLYGKKVDNLNEEFRLTLTRISDSINQLAKSGDESIVTNSQQRSAGNIANPSRLDHQNPRLSFRESTIPIKVFLCDKAIFGGAPGHHCRHPGAAGSFYGSDPNRLEKQRPCGFRSGGPARLRNCMLDRVLKFPHANDLTLPRDDRECRSTHFTLCLPDVRKVWDSQRPSVAYPIRFRLFERAGLIEFNPSAHQAAEPQQGR